MPRPFSTFIEGPNIVLLGNPGAGKSHLFRDFAGRVGVPVYTARRFLNAACINPALPLFIDALDERRAGRGDIATVDAIVSKLNQWEPLQVRIACRAADWLGTSDLAAFKDYFDGHGGHVVVNLEKLSREEQFTMLASVGRQEPDAFLVEAVARGLEDLTDNPQNLIMLHEAVQAGRWPATRAQLYAITADLLLAEHNSEHARRGAGVYTPGELRGSAGALFAARLISDVEGISLAEASTDANFPTYRTAPAADVAKAAAALSRRVFVSAGLPETAEYTHRTVAEYLAADWLANQIRDGLPVGRVRALIGVEGHPASELRGLHAWLPIFLPESAPLFIDADPFGVLTYGDAASLSPRNRQHLMRALDRLSQENPWFRGGNWEASRIGALSDLDMIEPFRAVLRSPTANFSLRSVVLDALSAGRPLPALEADIAAILVDPHVPYAQRPSALAALLQLPTGRETVLDAYRNRIGRTGSDLRLKAEIVSNMYVPSFAPLDIAQLLAAIRSCAEDLPIGSTWRIASAIPPDDIAPLLDQLPSAESDEDSPEHHNEAEVQHTVDTLISRAIIERPARVTPETLWRWLGDASREDGPHFRDSGPLRRTLEDRPELVRALADTEIDLYQLGSNRRWLPQSLQKITFGLLDPDDLLERLVESVDRPHSPAKLAYLYDLALNWSFRDSPRARLACQRLWAMADDKPELLSVRERCSSCALQDWRAEQVQASTRREEQLRQTKEFWQQRMRENAPAVRAGTDLNAMSFLSDLYLARFRDVDASLTPAARLVEFLGGEGASVAIEGISAILRRPDLPLLPAVVSSFASGRYYRWWNAITAGVFHTWATTGTLVDLSDELLRVFVLMRLREPPNRRTGGVLAQTDDALMQALRTERSALLRDAYVAMARADIGNNDTHPSGLHELLNDPGLAPYRSDLVVEFLMDFPHLPPRVQSDLLHSALALPDIHERILALARRALLNTTTAPENRLSWLAAAYLLAPDEFSTDIEAASTPDLVWKLRSFVIDQRRQLVGTPRLSVTQRQLLVTLTAHYYPETETPEESWGDENAWQASEFVRDLLTQLSNDSSVEASVALGQLNEHADLASYRPHVRHARASQHARRREILYVQPDWPATVAALSNGRPASAPDLHALLMAHLDDARHHIAGSNVDAYRPFWNEDSHGRLVDPKPEESCRQALVDMLRPRLLALGVVVEPEGHMVADGRADIVAFFPGTKIPVEIKRDYHADVWTAMRTQLERAYTLDPDTSGYGIYVVLWFGEGRTRPIPNPTRGALRPTSDKEMEQMLREMIPADQRQRLAVVVIDVSDPRLGSA